ncbi:MAG: hypothetical protein IJO85_07820 [Lachnospiraceae bacterium]|nr:hypothetical protein [Lachnospiraceae bacterium]
MKKNLGNAIVKKGITLAMAAMLVASSISMDSNAAEATNTNVIENVQDELNAKAEDAQKEADEAQKAVDEIVEQINNQENLTDDQKELLTNITEDLGKIDNKQNAVVIIDESKEIIADNVEDAIEDHVGNVGEVNEGDDAKVNKVEEAAKEATEKAATATDLDKTIDNYKEATDTLLNNDEKLVEAVEGNTDAEGKQVVETITSEGEVKVNVTDEEGNTTEMKVEDFTQQKVEEAQNAADVAEDALAAFKDAPSASNAEKQREKINEAIETAEAAKNDAETAYNAAESVLLEEIKTYNAYAAKYGYDLYTYNGETPTYTEEELAALTGLDKNKTDIDDGIKELNAGSLDEQLAVIEDAKSLVDSCGAAVTEAEDAVDQIVEAEKKVIDTLGDIKTTLENKLAEAKAELENASNDEKEALQKAYDALDALYKGYVGSYDSVMYDYTEKPHDAEDPNNKGIVTIKGRFEYAVDAAGDLADEINAMVKDANDKLDAATQEYAAAEKTYSDLQAEYQNYLENNIIDANFTALQAKLAAAEKAVIEAKKDFDDAVIAVDKAKDVKKDFEEAVSKMSSNDSGDSDDSSSSSSTPSATTASTVAIDENVVPLAGTVPAVEVPLTTIAEEPAPLADEVPKTGDASTAAGAVGASGLVAMLGALFMSIKKRTLR